MTSDSENGDLYVSNTDGNEIYVVDTSRNQLINTIQLPGSSNEQEGLAFDSKTNSIQAALFGTRSLGIHKLTNKFRK